MSNIQTVQTDDLNITNVHNLKPSRIQDPKIKGARQWIQWFLEMLGMLSGSKIQNKRLPTLNPMVAWNAWNAFRRPDWPPNKLTVEGKLSLDHMIVLLWGLYLPEWYTAIVTARKNSICEGKPKVGQWIVKPGNCTMNCWLMAKHNQNFLSRPWLTRSVDTHKEI